MDKGLIEKCKRAIIALVNRMEVSKNRYIRAFAGFVAYNPGIYLIKLIATSIKASSYYKSDFAWTLKRCYHISHKKRFGPSDQYFLGLLDPKLKPEDFTKYCAQSKLMAIQNSINPSAWAPVTENKGIFYRYCMANGIAIPKLYAIFFDKNAGWTYNGFMPKSRNEWSNYLENEIPSEFVIKPARGFYGQDINIFTRSGKTFVDMSGRSYTAKQIVDFMISTSRFDSFVIQERLKSHPELVRLSGSEVLQCVRFTTFINEKNESHILHRQLKVVVGSSVIDNFEYGKTGNVIAQISPSGFLDLVVTMKPGQPGVITAETHPKTGINFKGFQVPMWEEACEFAKDVAMKFSPLRAVGWDVAITPDGPYLIEGNFYFDAPNWHAALKDILDSIGT